MKKANFPLNMIRELPTTRLPTVKDKLDLKLIKSRRSIIYYLKTLSLIEIVRFKAFYLILKFKLYIIDILSIRGCIISRHAQKDEWGEKSERCDRKVGKSRHCFEVRYKFVKAYKSSRQRFVPLSDTKVREIKEIVVSVYRRGNYYRYIESGKEIVSVKRRE